jgi:hypothetical protein
MLIWRRPPGIFVLPLRSVCDCQSPRPAPRPVSPSSDPTTPPACCRSPVARPTLEVADIFCRYGELHDTSVGCSGQYGKGDELPLPSHKCYLRVSATFELRAGARDKYDHFALRLAPAIACHLPAFATEPIDDISTAKLMQGVPAAFAAVRQRCAHGPHACGDARRARLGRCRCASAQVALRKRAA